jgi:hypothetical protein
MEYKQDFDPCFLMLWLLSKVPWNNPIFGTIDNANPIMPRSDDDDGRKLTWTKLIKDYCGKITNRPENRLWCWFVPSNHTAGGTGTTRWSCKHKISSTGTGNW